MANVCFDSDMERPSWTQMREGNCFSLREMRLVRLYQYWDSADSLDFFREFLGFMPKSWGFRELGGNMKCEKRFSRRWKTVALVQSLLQCKMELAYH